MSVHPAHRWARALVALAVVCGTGCRQRALRESRVFEVHDAVVRAAPDTGATTVATVRLVNGGADPVTVFRFSSDAARTAVLVRGGVRVDSVTLSPRGTLVMRPAGDHIELRGTRRPLRPGDHAWISMRLSTGAVTSALARVR